MIQGKENRTSEATSDHLTFAKLGYADKTAYSEPFVCGSFTLTVAGDGENGKYFTLGHAIRIYSNGSFTIASEEAITKIILTWDGSDKPDANNVVNSGSYSFETGIWTGSSSSVTFTRSTQDSNHWKLKSVSVFYGEFESMDSVELKFGAKIPETTWAALESDYGISDYGVIIIKRHASDAPIASNFIQEHYEVGNAPYVIHTGNGNISNTDGEGNYVFTARVNIKDTSSEKYSTVFCAAPFICVDGQYRFLNTLQKSVNDLAAANDGTNLSPEALATLA